MGSKVGNTLLGIAAIITAVSVLIGNLPEPFSYLVGITVILIVIGIIFDVMGWI